MQLSKCSCKCNFIYLLRNIIFFTFNCFEPSNLIKLNITKNDIQLCEIILMFNVISFILTISINNKIKRNLFIYNM